MTAIQRDGVPVTPFRAWIREEPQLDSVRQNLSVTDTDIWDHRFSNRKEKKANAIMLEHLMLIEVKAFGADMPFAQRDTFDVIDQVLRKASTRNGRRWYMKIRDNRFGRVGGFRHVRWTGAHLLQMSHDRPDRSDRLLWDGRNIDLQILIEVLRFDRDPDHPTKLLDTRRHHLQTKREQQPQLLFVENAA